jgi:hypothetical protein
MWSLAIAVPLLLSPADDALPDPGKEAELELAAILETTRLALVNPSAATALVRLLDDQGSALETIAVPAFGERVLEFPRNTLAGTSLALVVATPSGRLVSGSYSVDELLAGGFRAVWFESVGSSLDAWGELPTGPAFIEPVPTSPRSALTAPVGPTFHVPVVIPANKPKGDLPPRIAPKPLPPV